MFEVWPQWFIAAWIALNLILAVAREGIRKGEGRQTESQAVANVLGSLIVWSLLAWVLHMGGFW